MNKAQKTYQTPGGAVAGLPEVPGALWYGLVRHRGEIHEVAVIREEEHEVLVSSPTFFGWVWRCEVVRDET